MLLSVYLLVAVTSTFWTPVDSFQARTSQRQRYDMPLSTRSRPPMPFISARSSSSSSDTEQLADASTSTSVPPRNAKHRRKNKKKRNKQSTITTPAAATSPSKSHPSDNGLSQQELAHHVAHQYLHGSGGLLRDRTLKTNKILQRSPHNYLQALNRRPSLVLNADYQPLSHLPLSLWHWQDAIKSVFSGKVTVVDVYPDVFVRAANLEIPLPSVIALNVYVPKSVHHHRPAFTKRNVFLRDEYRCQYCSDMFRTRDLSLDHVVPRSQGGNLSWENAVTCCHKCNGRKGCLPVSDLKRVGMKLVREPFVPSQYELAAVAGRMLPRRVHPTWKPYLGMQAEVESGGRQRTKGGGEEEIYLESDIL